MRRIPRRQCIWSGLLAVSVALAPAPAQQDVPPPNPVPAQPVAPPAPNNIDALSRARVAAAIKTYDLAWLYYSENRIDAGDVYGYSRLMYMAESDAATDKAGRVEAARGHRDRMERLWKKVSRVKKLGFSNTLDVNEVEYYYREADFWVAREQAWEDR